jgi:hypothetical protein
MATKRVGQGQALVALFLAFGAATIAAQPYAPQPVVKVTSDNVVLANHKEKHVKWAYSKKYGARYRTRRQGYTYYYEGYYYPRPYWRPGVSIQLAM